MSREADLYKDKIEVSLDGRQIFYLFFGGAVIVGLVFVLGVMVGRRVEARGHVDRARTTAAVDPLAALDRLEGNGGLSFKGSLMGTPAPSDVEHAIGEIEKTRAKPDAKHEQKPEPKVEAPKVEPKAVDAKVEAKPEAKVEPKALASADKPKKADEPKLEPKKADEPKLEAKKEDAKKLDEAKKPEKKSDAAEVRADKPKKADEAKKDEPKKVDAVADADKPKSEDKKDDAPKSKYTLQLSSFQDRAEADAFLSSLKAQGYQAHVTEATVSGKGTFYRVRMGTYKSIEAANDAKAEFERASKKSVSVMKI